MDILSHDELRKLVKRDLAQRGIKLEIISVSQFMNMGKAYDDNFILSHDAQMKAIGRQLTPAADGINISAYFSGKATFAGWMPLARFNQVEYTFNFWINDGYEFKHYYFVELDEMLSPIGIEDLL